MEEVTGRHLRSVFLYILCLGEQRRKAVCVRESDHLEVSDQRCEHLPRPVAVTEPCNTDCEVRWELLYKDIQLLKEKQTLTTCTLSNYLLQQVARCWKK